MPQYWRLDLDGHITSSCNLTGSRSKDVSYSSCEQLIGQDRNGEEQELYLPGRKARMKVMAYCYFSLFSCQAVHLLS